MIRKIAESIWLAQAGAPGPALAFSFGVHGNERPPVDAGLRLLAMLESDELALATGQLLLLHANPVATAEDRRWSEGGVDLNRCFSRQVLAQTPELYEERRAGEIAGVLQRIGPEALVDFHCTVEPGAPFLMQHPPVNHEPSQTITRLLSGTVLLADPDLNFGGVSLDEWMSTRGRVGVCYETGWMKSPQCTPEFVLDEMLNVLSGRGLIRDHEVSTHDDKSRLQLEQVVPCEGDGFHWRDGIGENLQELRAGTILGSYTDGVDVTLAEDATLIFPKKKPELVQRGKPLVYLGIAR